MCSLSSLPPLVEKAASRGTHSRIACHPGLDSDCDGLTGVKIGFAPIARSGWFAPLPHPASNRGPRRLTDHVRPGVQAPQLDRRLNCPDVLRRKANTSRRQDESHIELGDSPQTHEDRRTSSSPMPVHASILSHCRIPSHLRFHCQLLPEGFPRVLNRPKMGGCIERNDGQFVAGLPECIADAGQLI